MEFFIALLNCDTWWQLQHNILGSLTRSQVGRRRPCFPHLLLFRGSWVSLDRKRKAFRCFPYPLQSFPGSWKWLQLSTKLETFLISGMNFQFSGPHLTAYLPTPWLSCIIFSLLRFFFSPQACLSPYPSLVPQTGPVGPGFCLCLYLNTHPQELRRNEKNQSIFRGALCWLLAMQHQN